jgi:hypothetical protein
MPSIPQPSTAVPSSYGGTINVITNLRERLAERGLPPRYSAQAIISQPSMGSIPSGSMTSVTSARTGDEKVINGVVYYKAKVQKGTAGTAQGNNYKVDDLKKIAEYLGIKVGKMKKDELVDAILRTWDTRA